MNIKEEFIGHIKDREVLCASLSYVNSYDFDSSMQHMELPIGYTEEEGADFIDGLDFHYDPGFGSQELYGVIWYKDGTWSDRGEYDGKEWWQHHKCPDIYESLKK
jgi:hypothetical protein